MTASVNERKEDLRRRLRAEIGKLALPARAAAARRACDRLVQQPVWKNARTILFYFPLPDELDIWPLVNQALTDKRVVTLPRYHPEQNSYAACRLRDPRTELRPGNFGIQEPGEKCPIVPLNQLDLILVPGVGFDLNGRRLGRGKGYYDRLLSAARGLKCGLAFDSQVGIEIPALPHDVRVDYLLTPTRWLAVPGGGQF